LQWKNRFRLPGDKIIGHMIAKTLFFSCQTEISTEEQSTKEIIEKKMSHEEHI
jgi:hypothetical protein